MVGIRVGVRVGAGVRVRAGARVSVSVRVKVRVRARGARLDRCLPPRRRRVAWRVGRPRAAVGAPS
eukprot:scaffold73898_cov42-Phaeocystis_antarctica.AAC.1